MIKAVIFDLDDTLVESRLAKWNHHKFVAKKFYDLDVTDEDMGTHWGKPMHELIENLYKLKDTTENVIKNLISVRNNFPKKIYPDTHNVINEILARGMKLGIVSATLNEFVVSSLEEHNLPVEKFLIIQGADDTDFHKPNPRVFSLVIERLEKEGVLKEEILYVGDSITDFQAANGAGLNFIALTTGLYKEEDFKKFGAKIVVDRLGDIIQFL